MGKQTSKINMIFTGGHAATTALATIQELLARGPNKFNIHWIGSASSIEAKKMAGIEVDVFPKLGIATHYITAGRVQRRFSRHSISSLLKIPVGILQAFTILLKIRPKVIVSFGGYAGFPVVTAGWALRIPIILHEQTIATGLANKMSSFFARKVAISREESKAFFPAYKTVLTGNPIIFDIQKIKPKTTKGKPPTIFITGGSRGSQIINNTIDKILEHLLQSYVVIHQTGLLDFDRFQSRKRELENKFPDKYILHATISPLAIHEYYAKADLYIGRSGANTVSEIIATRRHAIFIPIPWARYNEQHRNALNAQSLGIAQILLESDLNENNLVNAIENQMENWQNIQKGIVVPKNHPDLNGATNLVNLILEFI